MKPQSRLFSQLIFSQFAFSNDNHCSLGIKRFGAAGGGEKSNSGPWQPDEEILVRSPIKSLLIRITRLHSKVFNLNNRKQKKNLFLEKLFSAGYCLTAGSKGRMKYSRKCFNLSSKVFYL